MTRTIGTEWLDELLSPGSIATQWTDGTYHAYLLEDGTLFDPTVDLYLADVPGGDRAAGPITLTGKTTSSGYFDADNITFTVADGTVISWLVIVQIGASEAVSPIVGSTDERADFSPLLFTGNGGTAVFQVQALGLGRI